MKDTIQKRIELWFRQCVIKILGSIFRRHNALPSDVNFNSCKFLFIRQDKIGDVLISTPLFSALKKHYPNATIDVLLSKKNYFVLENEQLIRKRWIYRKRIGNAISLIQALRNEGYDYAIDLMDNPSATSTIFCLLVNAKWNVGIAKDNSFIYDIVVPMLSRRDTHIINRISQLLTPFGINPSNEILQVRYFTSPESDAFANRFIKNKDLQNRRLIGINISAGGKVRFWGINNYRRLCKYIGEIYPEYSTVLLYQPSDVRSAQMIAESNSSVVLSPVTPKYDLFASLVKRLSFLITPDTSAVHLASAFKICVVVLYVQSNKDLRIWEPYGTDYETIVTDTDDLSSISVENVESALKNIIERHRKIIN